MPSSKKRTANGSLKKGGVEDLLYKHSLRAGNSVLKGESGGGEGTSGNASGYNELGGLDSFSFAERHTVYRESTLGVCLKRAIEDVGLSVADEEIVMKQFDVTMSDAMQAVPRANSAANLFGDVTCYNHMHDEWWFEIENATLIIDSGFFEADKMYLKCEVDRRRKWYVEIEKMNRQDLSTANAPSPKTEPLVVEM